MPTYEYKCVACGHGFERYESIAAPPRKDCPKCNKKKAKRLISAGAGFLFRGSGFFCNDYKKPDKSNSKEKKR